ncbi:MAG: hypothetical protein ACTSXT_09625 [Candidatus Helarchaeota archaeon]
MSNLENSKVIQKLIKELDEHKKNKFLIEVILIILTIVVTIYTVIFLYSYSFHIGYWSILPTVVFIIIIFCGFLENKHFKPNWQKYLIDILMELKKVNSLNLSNFINGIQSFIGGVYIHSSIILNIYDKLIKDKMINAKINDLDIELNNGI